MIPTKFKFLEILEFLFMPKKLSIGPLAVAGIAGGSILGGLLGAKGAEKAAGIAAGASRAATAETGRQFDITQENLAPFLEAGQGAVGELAAFGRSQVDPNQFIPESNIPQFDPNFDVFADPGVRFRQQEQERAINRQSAGLGKFLSGNRLAEIQQRGGDLASQEFGAARRRRLEEFDIARQTESTQFGRGVDAFGRARGEETDFLNRLASLSGLGQTAGTNLGQFGAGAAAETGRNLRFGAQAQGAAEIGKANAYQNVLGDLTSLATFQPNQFATGRV